MNTKQWFSELKSKIIFDISLVKNELSYRDLLQEIIKNKPADDRVKQCSAIRDNLETRKVVTVIYTDENQKPIWASSDSKIKYGFSIKYDTEDDELADLFKDKDILILQ